MNIFEKQIPVMTFYIIELGFITLVIPNVEYKTIRFISTFNKQLLLV